MGIFRTKQYKATCKSCGFEWFYTAEQKDKYNISRMFVFATPDPKQCPRCGYKRIKEVYIGKVRI